MSVSVEKLINSLKELDIEEKLIKDSRNDLMHAMRKLDENLDEISSKRSLILKELELANNNSSTDQSESEFQSLNSDFSFYPKSSDMDSDESTQKRKQRSDSTDSDIESKKVKSEGKPPNTVEDVNHLNQDMVDKCIDEMANKVIKELSGSDLRLKCQLEKLSEDPDFETLVKDVENDMKSECALRVHTLTQTSPSLLTLYRSNSTDGNFKENVSPSGKIRRTSSNRFKFDQQNNTSGNTTSSLNNNTLSPSFIPSKVLKGKKILAQLLSDKNSIDEQRVKSFTQKVEITSKCFKDNMLMWEKKATQENFVNKRKNSRTADTIQIKDIVDSI